MNTSEFMKTVLQEAFLHLETLPQDCRRLSNPYEILLHIAGDFPIGLKLCCSMQEVFQCC